MQKRPLLVGSCTTEQVDSVRSVSEPHAEGAPERLPRGPHGLTRDEVEESQRARLMLGAAEAVAAKGYAATSVADMIERAGVSRATFYQLYDDKADCFAAACAMVSEVLAEVMGQALSAIASDPDASPIERLDRLLGAYLDALAANPILARVFLVEVYAAGEAAIRARRDALEHFVDLVAATYGDAPGLLGSAPEQRFAAEVLVGAVSSMVTNAVALGEAERLPGLREPLIRLAAQLTNTAR